MARTAPPRAARLRRIPPLLLALALALGAVGPAGCSSQSPGPDASAPVVDLSPIPAPAGLVAEVFLPAPETTWAKARTAIGGPIMLLPSSIGGLVANLLGLPITVAGELDGAVPVLGAVIEAPERSRPHAALGVHVKAGERLVDQLTRGEGARFSARRDDASQITIVEPKDGAKSPAAFGVLGNYLLVGAELDDVTAAGPYVARTMSKAAVPKEDVAIEIPRAAIDGPILRAARSTWEKVRGPIEQPRKDIVAFIPTVESWLAILGDVEQARLTLVLDEAAHLRFAATPRAGDGAAARAVRESTVGDLRPLLELPADALVGLLWREKPGSRAEGIDKQVDAIGRFIGKDLASKDRDAIRGAIRAVSDARGDWFAAGLLFEGTGPTAYVRSAVSDGDKLEGGIGDMLELAKLKRFKEFLEEERLAISTGKTVIERLPGDVRRVRFERVEEAPKGKGKKKKAVEAPPPAAPVPKAVDLLYFVRDDGLYAAAGYDPKEALRRVVAAPGGDNLGGVPAFQAALSPIGADASFAIVVDPLRLVAARAGRGASGDPAPVVVATGATAASAGAPATLWARVDAANAAIRELVRFRGAL